MGMMIGFELKKIRHTFLQSLIFVSLAGPIVMIAVMYAVVDGKSFSEVLISISALVQLIPFAITVIFGCFMVAREYKDNMMTYLKITPQSQVRVLLSKLIVIVMELSVTQIITFILLFALNTVIDGYDTDLFLKYIGAGFISAGAFSCLVPLMIFISLLSRSFSRSALIFLLIFMLTFPFIFSENGYVFPHLLPMLLAGKFLGNPIYDKAGDWSGASLLIAAAAIFLYLSVRKTKKKE